MQDYMTCNAWRCYLDNLVFGQDIKGVVRRSLYRLTYYCQVVFCCPLKSLILNMCIWIFLLNYSSLFYFWSSLLQMLTWLLFTFQEMYTQVGPQFRDELQRHNLPTSFVSRQLQMIIYQFAISFSPLSRSWTNVNLVFNFYVSVCFSLCGFMEPNEKLIVN